MPDRMSCQNLVNFQLHCRKTCHGGDRSKFVARKRVGWVKNLPETAAWNQWHQVTNPIHVSVLRNKTHVWSVMFLLKIDAIFENSTVTDVVIHPIAARNRWNNSPGVVGTLVSGVFFIEEATTQQTSLQWCSLKCFSGLVGSKTKLESLMDFPRSGRKPWVAHTAFATTCRVRDPSDFRDDMTFMYSVDEKAFILKKHLNSLVTWIWPIMIGISKS